MNSHNYIVYYYKNKPFMAIPDWYKLSNIYPSLWKRLKFIKYKSEIKNIFDVLPFDFTKYCQFGIIYFNNFKTIIQDIDKKVVVFVKEKDEFKNDFYMKYNNIDFKTFKLPKVIENGGYYCVFEYIDGESKDLEFNIIKSISDEIYQKLSFHHGDLHSTNIITKNNIHYVIDWDDINKYSNNYDFCYYFLSYSLRKFERGGMTKKNIKYFQEIKFKLLKYVSNEDFQKCLNTFAKIRKFKYLKRIQKL